MFKVTLPDSANAILVVFDLVSKGYAVLDSVEIRASKLAAVAAMIAAVL